MANKENEISKALRVARIWLFIGIGIVIISPFIFTLPNFWSYLDFTKTSSIGDTIGGITAPFVNILGSVLVFYALKAQVKANELLGEQINEQKRKDKIQNERDEINQLYSNLKNNIDNFSYSTLNTFEFGKLQSLTGSEAIYKLFNDFYCDCHISEDELKGNPKITELISILEICDIILEKLRDSKIPDREVMKTLTLHQFKYRVLPRINFDIDNLNKHFCAGCNQEHGLPNKMVELIKRIDKYTK